MPPLRTLTEATYLMQIFVSGFYGAILSAVAITALFLGQRIAGAAVLIPYFLLVLFAIYLLAQS